MGRTLDRHCDVAAADRAHHRAAKQSGLARRRGARANSIVMQLAGLTNRRGTRAAALMLALWALFLLSAMVISWALDINTRLVVAGNANRIMEAEALACSGAEVALHPYVKPDSPNLVGEIGEHGSYEAHITGEGGRLNVNWLLAGEDPVR